MPIFEEWKVIKDYPSSLVLHGKMRTTGGYRFERE